MLRQDQAWFSIPGHSADESMASVETDVGHLSGLSGIIVGTKISVLVSVIGGIVLAHIVAWKIAVVLLSAVPVVVLAGFMPLRLLSKIEERHETAYNFAAALASEGCRSIRTVAASDRERQIFQQYHEALEDPYRQSFKFNVLGNLMLVISLAITCFVYALAYYWGSQQVREGYYTQQDCFIVLPTLLFSAQSSGQLFSLAPELTLAKTAAENVLRLHDSQPSLMRGPNPTSRTIRGSSNQHLNSDMKGTEKDQESLCDGDHEKPATPTLPMTNLATLECVATHKLSSMNPLRCGSIQLEDVSLVYPSRPKKAILQNVTLRIEPGQFVGIVGPAGAGKSSLIALLQRFYDPVCGTVSMNGEESKTYAINLLKFIVRDWA